MSENLLADNILIFSGVIAVVSIVSYILLKAKNQFWVPLVLTFVCMSGLSLFINKIEDPLQYTNMDTVGVWSGFAMIILYALIVGMMSINMVGLCVDLDDEFGVDNNFMSLLPFAVIITTVLLTLHKYEVVPLEWCWGFLGAVCIGCIAWIIFGNLDFDIDKESSISLPGIASIFIMYCYIVPIFCEHAAVAVFGGALFIYLLLKYEFDCMTDFGSSHSVSTSYNSNYTTRQNQITNQLQAQKNTVTVTIQGVYQLNGPKPFSRDIECDKSETGYYSRMKGSKAQQAAWISANFPGADTNRGFSMSINIK